MFDPEKVERFATYRTPNVVEVVRASDYDQLLQLYREAQRKLVEIGALYGVGPEAAKVPEGFYGKGIADIISRS